MRRSIKTRFGYQYVRDDDTALTYFLGYRNKKGNPINITSHITSELRGPLIFGNDTYISASITSTTTVTVEFN
jgi:hypothetical protein